MSRETALPAVVAGHICLDMIPGLEHLQPGQFAEQFQPGHLINAGPAAVCTGGPVSNTGLALHRLGVPTRLIARVGADPFGDIVRQLVARHDPRLTEGIVADAHSPTSYSVVISAPGRDRTFLHCPGANDTFGPEDINLELVRGAALFHFGYPPLMRRMYLDGGRELTEVLRLARSTGATTSLDMSFPDPTMEGGKLDWAGVLHAALPLADIFMPSIEELLFCLRRGEYERLAAQPGGVLERLSPALLSSLSDELLGLGVKIAGIKLGHRGLYLRTAGREALAQMGRAAPADPAAWAGLELWAPCFRVQVVGTTGSGDATIAGFLAALLRGLEPRLALLCGVAVGACNVEAADALSGIRDWPATRARLASGWAQHPLRLDAPGWAQGTDGLWQKVV